MALNKEALNKAFNFSLIHQVQLHHEQPGEGLSVWGVGAEVLGCSGGHSQHLPLSLAEMIPLGATTTLQSNLRPRPLAT